MTYPDNLYPSLTGIRITAVAAALCLLVMSVSSPVQADSQLDNDALLLATGDGPAVAGDSFSPLPLQAALYNPFDDKQLAALVRQGQQEQEAGNHQLAVQAFEQAWQTSRINYGLYHSAQIPLVESLIASQIELQDWQSLDNHYAYLELLYRRLYDTEDKMLEAGLQKVSSWHINAFNLNLDGRREQHLRKARALLKLRLEIAEHTLPDGHPRFEFLHESIRLSEQYLYLMSERYKQQLRQRESTQRDRLLATLD